ncbi:TPA: hypothetical protein PXM79_004098 [Yersinia enterocolitica]|nr:hypothetical protein [Yersinia enterocolitica]
MIDDSELPPRDEMIKKLIDQATESLTVDFDKLESDGVIKKVRGGYLVINHRLLPQAANRLIKSTKNTKDGLRVIIGKPSEKLLKVIKSFKS